MTPADLATLSVKSLLRIFVLHFIITCHSLTLTHACHLPLVFSFEVAVSVIFNCMCRVLDFFFFRIILLRFDFRLIVFFIISLFILDGSFLAL